MRYRILNLPADRSGTRRRELRGVEAAGGAWARFGREVLVQAADARWRGLDEGLGRRARDSAAGEGEVRRGHLHLVVQKGRTFQLENPEVRVVLDKGRFLVVDLPPAKGRSLSGRRDPCFHIEPLPENVTVFEERAPAARREEAAPAVAAVVAAVSQAGFEAALARLTSIPSRLSTSPGYAEAAEWMQGELAVLGLDARLEPINVNGAPSHNVVAFRPGTGADRQHFLVTGHLDSVNHPGGPTAPAPGADDNGSGSAGVLNLARALAGAALTHDVTFILFGGEEQGLHGSKQFVANLPEPERRRIRAVLNMDMIGSLNSQPASVLLEGATLSQGMIDGLADAAARFTSLAVQTSLNPFASDHVPFIEAGIPAVLTIEGADSANEAIHTGDDTLDRVDPAFATEILRMNAGFLATAAEAVVVAQPQPSPPPAPVPSPCGCGGSSVPAQGVAAMRDLSGHYHALFAQYARLHREGTMQDADLANWRAAWLAYDTLVGSAGG